MKFASVLFHRSIRLLLSGVTLASLALGIYLTRSGNTSVIETAQASGSAGVVDQSALTTARHLAAQAHGPDEQQQAVQAVQVADHAVDQAFEIALREAKADTPPLKGEALAVSQKIAALETTVDAEKQHVITLTAARLKTASQDDVAQLGAQAQAQLDLDIGRLNDLHQDLILLGDKQAKIQQAFDEHEAMQEQPIVPDASENDLESSQRMVTLPGEVRALLEIRDRERQVRQAGAEATTAAARLTREHEALKKENELSPNSESGTTSTTATVDPLNALSSPQKTMTEYDARIQDQQQLAAIYGSWAELTETKRLTVLRGILFTLATIAAIMLAVLLGIVLIRSEFARRGKERLRLGHHPVAVELVMELVALAIILIVIFGTPAQMPAVLGL